MQTASRTGSQIRRQPGLQIMQMSGAAAHQASSWTHALGSCQPVCLSASYQQHLDCSCELSVDAGSVQLQERFARCSMVYIWLKNKRHIHCDPSAPGHCQGSHELSTRAGLADARAKLQARHLHRPLVAGRRIPRCGNTQNPVAVIIGPCVLSLWLG